VTLSIPIKKDFAMPGKSCIGVRQVEAPRTQSHGLHCD